MPDLDFHQKLSMLAELFGGLSRIWRWEGRRRRRRAYQKGQQQLAYEVGGHWRWAEQGRASPGSPSLGTLALHDSLVSPSLVFHSELAK